ncbi:MAG: hypothetical protein LUI10_13190 [Lachnospiraceae bacterium]|nr:hypothetical protein [Lachnospiraceae bacterium]
MRKFIIGSCVVMAVLVGAIIWALQPLPEKEEDVFNRIGQAPCAKFEYCESEEPIFVTSEIRQLSTSFLSLTLESSDIPVSDWIYRVTFYNRETFIGEDQEIVILVGENSLSVNGEIYSTPEEIPYESILEYYDGKYQYFTE